MPTNADAIALLVYKYMTDDLSELEHSELKNWIAASEPNRLLFEELSNPGKIAEYSAVRKKFLDKNRSGKVIGLTQNWIRYAAAAAIILFIAAGGYMWFTGKKDQPVVNADTEKAGYKNDVEPGQFKARLTLADGSTIILDSVSSGVLTKQGNTEVLNKNGQLVYESSSSSPLGEAGVRYNTLSTSIGETYSLMLSDGSRVWLNSASSITYPVNFTGRERNVEIKGEAYFDVTKSITSSGAKQPFIVKVNDMMVEVLGTEFNVNGYSDEDVVKTTLVEGKVKITKVTSGERSRMAVTESQILSPGQQAQFSSANGSIKLVNDVNIDETIAWKNGMFLYDTAKIEDIMKQVARWYDVEVVFEGKINADFRASIPRNVPVSRLLRIFEMAGGVHFKVEGKRITVMP